MDDSFVTDPSGLKTKITLIAGESHGNSHGNSAPEPTNDSWAKDKNHHLSIQFIELEPGASYLIPKVSGMINRSVSFYSGEDLLIEEEEFPSFCYAFVTANNGTALKNEGSKIAKLLFLESEPIPEPIVAKGHL